MTASKIRQKFLDFFKEKGHSIIESASLVPENDPTVLFTTAGMHPLIPYLLGQKHPQGKKLANVQKCIRTGDIDEVGNSWHLTFFEMLGNWSLGDAASSDGIGQGGYFKKEAIEMSWQFLTDKKWLGISPDKISVSVFAGDKDVPFDQEAFEAWKSVGLPEKRIFKYGKDENWWGPAGQTGPCGPDTEMYYDTGRPACADCQKNGPACQCGKFAEIWNDVFMEFNKTEDGQYKPLKQKNVDTGMGLERTAAVLQGKNNVFAIELFQPLIEKIEDLSQKKYTDSKEITRQMRIVADHIKAATFILGDDKGVTPSNVEQGYVLRKLIRRTIRYGKSLNIEENFISKIAQEVVNIYKDDYQELSKNKDFIIEQLTREEENFKKTLVKGLKELEKMNLVGKAGKITEKTKAFNRVDAEKAFYIYQTFGFPLEMIQEELARRCLFVDEEEFNKEFKKHQDLSRQGTEQKFKSGLADHSVETTKLHTAAHLMLAALRQVLGDHVYQKGSNITADRLRFDFSHAEQMTEEQIKQVEDLVNRKIKEDLEVQCQEMSTDQAKEQKAMGVFEHKYGLKVKVYSVGDFSKEICAGPHVQRTGQLGKFKIVKEQSSSAGIRRLKAVLE